jgi:hypothetical protein
MMRQLGLSDNRTSRIGRTNSLKRPGAYAGRIGLTLCPGPRMARDGALCAITRNSERETRLVG